MTSNGFMGHFCKKNGHFKKNCERYKVWLTKQGDKQHEANGCKPYDCEGDEQWNNATYKEPRHQ